MPTEQNRASKQTFTYMEASFMTELTPHINEMRESVDGASNQYEKNEIKTNPYVITSTKVFPRYIKNLYLEYKI